MTNDETTPDDRTTPVDPTTPTTPFDGAPAPARRPRRAPRFGTVFWGVVLLVFAAAMAVSALPWFTVDPMTLLLGACLTAGVLLVVAGVAAVIARPRR
ncbi:hypothetical protein BIV03_10040 [Curtobacterium sp. MCBA15_016]|uniref:hypothetical protein n=1 Tax=Curtobacterium sp. MCBA15_016 TaxID=1898740 RepID=UPI0008DCC9D9|nr:hypothetical protein [Curtobacterium sp. MCBA15_016]OII24379.1 hypothetical protein BIV03_10040 [Curtobacterium sp. MCBA15_016]